MRATWSWQRRWRESTHTPPWERRTLSEAMWQQKSQTVKPQPLAEKSLFGNNEGTTTRRWGGSGIGAAARTNPRTEACLLRVLRPRTPGLREEKTRPPAGQSTGVGRALLSRDHGPPPVPSAWARFLRLRLDGGGRPAQSPRPTARPRGVQPEAAGGTGRVQRCADDGAGGWSLGVAPDGSKAGVAWRRSMAT